MLLMNAARMNHGDSSAGAAVQAARQQPGSSDLILVCTKMTRPTRPKTIGEA